MNEAMRELYQETIMGHNRSPHNFHTIDDAAQADGHNPLCGDRLTVFLRVDDERIEDIAFMGEGCAISKSSASMMTDALKGKSSTETRAMQQAFHALITRTGDVDEDLLGKLRVFAGVGEFPARVKCAALPWRTMIAALEGQEKASTE